MKNTKKIVLCGILCAFTLILLFVSSVSVILDYTILAIASVIIMVAVIEMSASWALLVYAATVILSLFLIPMRETKLVFIFFIGYYPVIKSVFEKVNNRVLEYVLKIASFNISIFLCVYLFWALFFDKQDVLTPVILIVAAVLINVAFILYDIALSKIAMYYMFKIKPRMKFLK